MSEWPLTTIGDLKERGALEFGDGYRTKRTELGTPGIPILRVAEVGDGKIAPKFEDHVRASYISKMGGKTSRPGDIVLTTKGTVGRSAIISGRLPQFVYSPQVCYFRVINQNIIDTRYLYYWLKGESFQSQARSYASQTDMAAYLNLTDIHSLKIAIPEINIQREIGDALGALDDKIEVNERIAKSVDLLASAIFDHLRCSHPFQKTTLKEVADVNAKKPPKRTEGAIRYIDIASVGDGEYTWPSLIDWQDAPSRARRLASAGDTIWSTVRPNRRSHALVMDSDPNLVFSTGLAVLTPRNVGPAFLYETTRTPQFQSFLESSAEGSAYPSVNSSKFSQAPVFLPPKEALGDFEETAMPLRERAHRAAVESRTLATLRDTLLPQLMSGKLRVKDAERVVENAV
ncbi:restriction endonuclease subunit S [Streptomonospora sediminis]